MLGRVVGFGRTRFGLNPDPGSYTAAKAAWLIEAQMVLLTEENEGTGQSLRVEQVETPAGDQFTIELYKVSDSVFHIYVNNTHVITEGSHNKAKTLYGQIKKGLEALAR